MVCGVKNGIYWVRAIQVTIGFDYTKKIIVIGWESDGSFVFKQSQGTREKPKQMGLAFKYSNKKNTLWCRGLTNGFVFTSADLPFNKRLGSNKTYHSFRHSIVSSIRRYRSTDTRNNHHSFLS